MKMVLVYDTDNVEDYQNSIGIMRKLVNDYDEKHSYAPNTREFGRIRFIKILRQWEREAAETQKNSDGVTSLRAVKRFADNIWRENK